MTSPSGKGRACAEVVGDGTDRASTSPEKGRQRDHRGRFPVTVEDLGPYQRVGQLRVPRLKESTDARPPAADDVAVGGAGDAYMVWCTGVGRSLSEGEHHVR